MSNVTPITSTLTTAITNFKTKMQELDFGIDRYFAQQTRFDNAAVFFSNNPSATNFVTMEREAHLLQQNRNFRDDISASIYFWRNEIYDRMKELGIERITVCGEDFNFSDIRIDDIVVEDDETEAVTYKAYKAVAV